MKEDRRYHPTMMRLILSLIKSGRFRAFCRPSWHRNGRSNRQSDYCGHYELTFGDEEEFLRQKTDPLLIIFWSDYKSVARATLSTQKHPDNHEHRFGSNSLSDQQRKQRKKYAFPKFNHNQTGKQQNHQKTYDFFAKQTTQRWTLSTIK